MCMHSYSVRDTVYFMHIMLSMHTYSRSTTLVVVIYIIIHTYIIYIYPPLFSVRLPEPPRKHRRFDFCPPSSLIR